MKRIGILLASEPGGGTFQYTQAMLDAVLALPPGEFSVTAAVFNPDWLDHLRDDVAIVPLAHTQWNRGVNKAWHVSRLPIAVWRRTAARLDSNVRALLKADAALWVCPNQDRYAFRAPIRALGTVHDLMHRYEPRFPEVTLGGEYHAREFHFRETCRWSTGVLVDSEVGKRQLVESYGIAPTKVFPLPYIAPSYIYDKSASTPEDVTRRYGLPDKFLFYPAQFFRHKNHAMLVSTIGRLRRAHPDVRLVLAGAQERNAYADIRRMVDEQGLADNVLFLGYVPQKDMPALYRKARALVMPTFFGPTNIPQLEAFALGCPVATSRIYGIPEQVGDAALLFDPSSAEQIHAALLKLWTDDALCAELTRRGFERAHRWGPSQFNQRFREIVDALT
ncbi:MAG TPA: glycosyltransferase family 1 protein [Gemmatimonadaceae bacterium]|nr:glycosyltransferase family 1 protein [Gemmatimonadaceae bacterium]